MLIYESGIFGFRTLPRVQGSAVYKAVLPALVSTGLLALYAHFMDHDNKIARNPTVCSAYITSFAFLLTFRLNYAYQRYWEGATQVHQMVSKFLDAAINLAAYHYQSEVMAPYSPPSFGTHENLQNYKRERCSEQRTLSEALLDIQQAEKKWYHKYKSSLPNKNKSNNNNNIHQQHRPSNNNNDALDNSNNSDKSSNKNNNNNSNKDKKKKKKRMSFNKIALFQRQFSVKSNRTLFKTQSSKFDRLQLLPEEDDDGHNDNGDIPNELFTIETNIKPPPSLYLQEIAHLFSLLTAVALSTLRNDIEGAPSPLIEYLPGQPMAPVNSDEYYNDDFLASSATIASSNRSPSTGSISSSIASPAGTIISGKPSLVGDLWNGLYFILGLSRSPHHRTLYNAARPFRVLGGVSDGEIIKLQEANGPYAKTSLCSMWLQEFISREYLAGSIGKVPPPILSRVYQFISDGMKGYNQARKVAYVPFPFPHAQLATFFTFVTLVFVLPVLYYTWINSFAFACVLNFTTVLCTVGMHEVARELENPMHNTPNDLPLLFFQAQFNEALITMYSGFHPDSHWTTKREAEDDGKDSTKNASADIDDNTAATDTKTKDIAILEEIKEEE